MKITGELLKSERLRQGLSVQDVAFSLKLSSKIVAAIEVGQVDELPAKTFVRGFVKSYAQLLKIDVDQVMRQFQEEMGSTQPMPKTPPPMSAAHAAKGEGSANTKKEKSQPVQNLNNDHSKKTLVYVGIAIVLVILIITTNKVIDKYQKDSADNVAISQIKPLEPALISPIIVSGDAISKLSVPESSTGVSAEGAAMSVAPISSIAASLDNSSTMTLPVEDGFERTLGKPVEVIIEAKKNVELHYAKGSSKTFSKLNLQAKQIQVIRSPDGLYLKTDDGGALHLIVNGVEKGNAGANNKTIKLTF